MYAFHAYPHGRIACRIGARLGVIVALALFGPALRAAADAATQTTAVVAVKNAETWSTDSAATSAQIRQAETTRRYRLSETWSTRFAGADTKLTAGELDGSRGGFSSSDGFDFSFGLTNMRRVNDEPLVTQQLFNVKDVIGGLADSGIVGSSGQPAVSGQPVTLQLGAGNRIAPSVLAQRAGIPKTIIQNSLDNQHIRNTNVYNFKLINVGVLTRAVNRNARRAALSQRLVDSIR